MTAAGNYLCNLPTHAEAIAYADQLYDALMSDSCSGSIDDHLKNVSDVMSSVMGKDIDILIYDRF